jgi:predicted ribosome quality control (RQC) complex YloA/Tae2 family protein
MQPVDYTTLTAICAELKKFWIPAKVDQVYQSDRFTISLALRTLKTRDWLTICWHPQAARICIDSPPPRIPDTFTFSDQLRHQLNRYALINIEAIDPWERVLDLQFAHRPNETPSYHLYIEIMGKYSNVILTDNKQQIITVGHQVTSSQSSFRTVQTGQIYQLPPSLTGSIPKLTETQASWQERVSLIPGKLKQQLLKTYRGLSPYLVNSMLEAADLDTEINSNDLTTNNWHQLFIQWQKWLAILESKNFQPGWTKKGYTVIDWGIIKPEKNVQTLISLYYSKEFNQEIFKQLHHQLSQKISNFFKKTAQKRDTYKKRLQESKEADNYKYLADILMANLHLCSTGMQEITLSDFETGKPVKIKLNPEKNGVQNAQLLYKQHQKLKRAQEAVAPLLKEVEGEISYLENIETNLTQLENYHNKEDLQTLEEIKEELILQKYIQEEKRTQNVNNESKAHSFITPSGFELLVGRNNKQNDHLTFKVANDYDLWFHTQEIAGSHALLRLPPGEVAQENDLQFAANITAYYSKARESEQVPVIYTKPKYVYKPKGAKPGMTIYKHETVIWGRPQQVKIL